MKSLLQKIQMLDIEGRKIPGRTVSEKRLQKSIFRLLQGNVLCSMATVYRLNRAHISHVYFCYSNNLELYFLSYRRSIHARNLNRNASMAVTVFDSSQKWGRPNRGMHLFGTCRETKGKQAENAERLYGARFRAYRKWMEDFEKNGKHRASQLWFYRFVPNRIKILDEREFGGLFVTADVKRKGVSLGSPRFRSGQVD